MEPTNKLQQPQQSQEELEFDRNFTPKGAITFFILFVILGLIIWYGVYLIMLQRI
jgi:hypothetical protein